jgi:hypothetical protein
VILYLAQPFSDDTPRFGSPYSIDPKYYFEEARFVLHSSQFHIAYWQSPWLMLIRGAPQGNEQPERDAIQRQLDRMEQR